MKYAILEFVLGVVISQNYIINPISAWIVPLAVILNIKPTVWCYSGSFVQMFATKERFYKDEIIKAGFWQLSTGIFTDWYLKELQVSEIEKFYRFRRQHTPKNNEPHVSKN